MRKILFTIFTFLIFLTFSTPFIYAGTTVDDETLGKIGPMKTLTIVCRWESDNSWVSYTTDKKIKGLIIGAWFTPGTTSPKVDSDCVINTQGATAEDIFGTSLSDWVQTTAKYREPLLASSNYGGIPYDDKVSILWTNNDVGSATGNLQIWFFGEYAN